MAYRLLFPALALLASLPAPGAAQHAAAAEVESPTPADSTPESLVRQHLRATIRQDWAASVALTHPDELARTRAAFLPIFTRDTTGLLAPSTRQGSVPKKGFGNT